MPNLHHREWFTKTLSDRDLSDLQPPRQDMSEQSTVPRGTLIPKVIQSPLALNAYPSPQGREKGEFHLPNTGNSHSLERRWQYTSSGMGCKNIQGSFRTTNKLMGIGQRDTVMFPFVPVLQG